MSSHLLFLCVCRSVGTDLPAYPAPAVDEINYFFFLLTKNLSSAHTNARPPFFFSWGTAEACRGGVGEPGRKAGGGSGGINGKAVRAKYFPESPMHVY